MSEDNRYQERPLNRIEECSRDVLALGALVALVLLLGTPLVDAIIPQKTSTVQVIAER